MVSSFSVTNVTPFIRNLPCNQSSAVNSAFTILPSNVFCCGYDDYYLYVPMGGAHSPFEKTKAKFSIEYYLWQYSTPAK